jgi:Fe-S oxidoreductase
MPDKLLTAMDIMDRLADDWSFLPGLAGCCGGNHNSAGYLEAGLTAMNELADSFQSDEFEAIVLWCPTCVTRFHLSEVDLPTISFARFVTDRLADQAVSQADIGPITLHDPCKNFFLGIDTDAPRELLAKVTGQGVREMPRKSVCCGWNLLKGSPEVGRRWINDRLKEASDTGAGTMVNICHGCHWLFTSPDWTSEIGIANYVTLAGQSMGIRHEERFLKWRRWDDPDRIMADMGDKLDRLPWPRNRIEAVVRKAFGSEVAADCSG